MTRFDATEVEGDGLVVYRRRRDSPPDGVTRPLAEWAGKLQSIIALNSAVMASGDQVVPIIDWNQVSVDFAAWLQTPAEADENFKSRRG